MNDKKINSAILMLQDGAVFYGKALGKTGITSGEICFNTGMTGYQEIFTDPSYFGQVMVTTNAHIGNYGVKSADTQSEKMQIAGLICKNFTVVYSRQQAEKNIQEYFENEGVTGISDVDTRAIVRRIRHEGAMNAVISSTIFDLDELKTLLDQTPDMNGLELSTKVSVTEAYTTGDPQAKHKIAVMDYGVKKSILRNFENRDCYLKIFPAKTPFKELKAWNPDGYFLSNGPGDPASMDYAIQTVKDILAEEKPLFGICLGHQLLALALDVPTYKMRYGHRGLNHPILNLTTGKSEITSQNHGFGVDPQALRAKHDLFEITHINLNDDTIEGIRLKNKKAFSVQYHPEASPGPHDSKYLFDQFVALL